MAEWYGLYLHLGIDIIINFTLLSKELQEIQILVQPWLEWSSGLRMSCALKSYWLNFQFKAHGQVSSSIRGAEGS